MGISGTEPTSETSTREPSGQSAAESMMTRPFSYMPETRFIRDPVSCQPACILRLLPAHKQRGFSVAEFGEDAAHVAFRDITECLDMAQSSRQDEAELAADRFLVEPHLCHDVIPAQVAAGWHADWQ